TDIIYNYGTFDFEDPDFYIKFMKGNMRYYVSPQSFNDFIYEYQLENRSVAEQKLNLTCTQKEELFAFLRENAKEENKYYQYEFLYDNCTSRLRDIIKRHAGQGLVFRNILPNPPP